MKLKKYNDLLILPNLNKTEFVPVSQIVFCERYKGATKLHLAMPSSIIAKDSLTEVMQIIDDNSFFEINESQFLNKAYLKSFNESERLLITSLQHKLIFSK